MRRLVREGIEFPWVGEAPGLAFGEDGMAIDDHIEDPSTTFDEGGGSVQRFVEFGCHTDSFGFVVSNSAVADFDRHREVGLGFRFLAGAHPSGFFGELHFLVDLGEAFIAPERVEAEGSAELPQAYWAEVRRPGICFGKVGTAIHGTLVVDTVGEAKEVAGLVSEELGGAEDVVFKACGAYYGYAGRIVAPGIARFAEEKAVFPLSGDGSARV